MAIYRATRTRTEEILIEAEDREQAHLYACRAPDRAWSVEERLTAVLTPR